MEYETFGAQSYEEIPWDGRRWELQGGNTPVPLSPHPAASAPPQPGLGGITPVPLSPAQENAFKPDVCDFLFALAVFVLGYLFSCWVLFTWRGWGVSAFTTVYLLSVTVYLLKKGVYVKSRAAWFWLTITWVTGISYSLWENAGLAQIKALFLFCAAVYYVIIASRRTVMGKTGNYLILDGINAVIILPFRNIINQYVSFVVLKKRTQRRGKALPVILGVVLALLLVVCLLPMLERADSGGFSMILRFFADIFTIRIEMIIIITTYVLSALPIAAYLYGLVSGAAHEKGTDIIKPDDAKKAVADLRFLQPATIFIVLSAVCGLYLIFILSQIPYFFSAFTGVRPDGWLIYSQYARQGFFELCGIAAINLAIVMVSNVTCKRHRMELKLLKAFNIALALITLLLIATAFSKMAMYIDAYGLTMPRLLPCVFMVLMATVFVALIFLQKWNFSIVRFALVTGSVMLCILFMSNPDALVVRYNTDRYLSGTLSEYDTEVLYRAGHAGVLPAIEIYEKASDEQLRSKVVEYLEFQLYSHRRGIFTGLGQGAHEYSVELQRARSVLIITTEVTAP